jgi:TPR repeat protein
MIAAMRWHAIVIPSTLLSLLLAPAVARAQFYDLDGAYRCLTQPDAACQQAEREEPPEAAPPKPAHRSGLTLDQVIAHVREKAVTAADIRLLEAQTEKKNRQAVEVLAWCKLNGIGMPADAVGAYWLYGEAADLGVAHARQNQITIDETRLTPDQRQQVLLRQNAR